MIAMVLLAFVGCTNGVADGTDLAPPEGNDVCAAADAALDGDGCPRRQTPPGPFVNQP